MRTIRKALIAEHILSTQPPSIGSRLKRDEAQKSRLGIHIRPTIGILGRALKRSEVLQAARRVLSRGEDEILQSLEGEEITVSKQRGSIALLIKKESGEILRVPFEELDVLSSKSEERLEALDRSLQKIGPTGPDLSALRQTVLERELTAEETGELLEALWHGVAAQQARIRGLLDANRATLQHFIPESFDYFERFCGPDPAHLAPEEYLGATLPEYRKSLLSRGLKRGLEICLFGALRDDLCPGAWLAEIGDDELWETLQACQPTLDPYSLLGALDVTLYRQHDERFRAFAEEAVTKLTADEFVNEDGLDLYQVLPFLAQFVLNRIHLLENGALRAPFWKRMCAWMQSLMAMRLLAGLADSRKFREQLESHLMRAGLYANLVDCQKEPMVHAAGFSPSALRGEVVGRLVELQRRHLAAGHPIPRAEDIQKAVGRLAETAAVISISFPGPLEGHRRPEESGNGLPPNLKEEILKLPAKRLLNSLINFSQLFHFDEETRARCRESISNDVLEREGLDVEERLSCLANAGAIAAAARDEEMAQAIAGAILSLAQSLSEASVVIAIQGLLLAGAAFRAEDAWAQWLKEQLSRLANLLPAGKVSGRLYQELQELKKVTKLELCITGRAGLLASAGAASLE